ncbi:MAG: FAD-dependent oxidoreductase [Nannocystaceae bacterium]|nr:FAD-dependent oxidoreductase [Nannocystaceae bacterium]
MTLPRRTVLRAGAASLGALACPRSGGAAPTVRFVGVDPARGHLLRAREQPLPPPSQRRRARVVVVGAGVAGLSAAWRLQRGGEHDLAVLELDDEVGGTARGGTLPRSRYPMGAHYLPVPQPGFTALETLLEDLGVLVGRDAAGRAEYDPTMICRAPVERYRLRGQWHAGLYPDAGETADERATLERFQARLRALDRIGRDGRRLFALPLQHSSDELRALDGETMAQWLARETLQGWRLQWLCDYGCRDDYGCTASQASAFAGLHHFVARGLEHERDRMLLTWPQGNAALCEALLQRLSLGERLSLGTVVVAIDPDRGELLALQARDGEAPRVIAWQAEHILWAAPRFVLPHVLPPGRDPLPAGARTYTPWLVANVEVDVAPTGIGAPLSWDNVAIEGEHLGYVVANHLEPLSQRNRGGAVLTYYEPRPADDAAALARGREALLSASAEALAEHVIAQLAAMHPSLPPHIRAIDLCRWGHAMVRPVPGAMFGPAAAQASAPVGRVRPCAADCSALPLFEQAFANGVAAAEAVLARGDANVATMLPT